MTKMHPAALLSRYWPFANGSGRILDLYAKNVDLGTGEAIAQTSDGFPIYVYADDHIGRHILLSGKFDRSIVQVLIDLASPGDTLLDIGANIGYYSAVFLAKVKGSKSICIEPQPGIVNLLEKNMAQFGDRAVVHAIGLADQTGTLRFAVDEKRRGRARISENGKIQIEVLEAGNAMEALDRVDLVKIDVEGYEEPVLRSAQGELMRLRPRAIVFEDHTADASPKGKIGRILSALGYRIFGIDKRLLKTDLVRVYSRDECRFSDYLAVL